MDYPKQIQSWLSYLKKIAPAIYQKATDPTVGADGLMPHRGFYILEEDGTIRHAHNMREAERFLQDWRRKSIAQTLVNEEPKVHVSTVFLALDHNFAAGEPILFETMIFGGEHDGECERYHTVEEATVGHRRAVALAQQGSFEMRREDND